MSSAPSLRARALALDAERAALERTVAALAGALGAEATAPLVVDGAPRADVDVAAILAQRGELARARNDLRAKYLEVEAAMHAAFAAAAADGSGSGGGGGGGGGGDGAA